MINLGDITNRKGRTFSGSLKRPALENRHTFNLTAKCKVTIYLIPPLGNLDLSILSSDNNYLYGLSNLSGRQKDTFTVVLGPGTYSIRVSLGEAPGKRKSLPYRIGYKTPLTNEPLTFPLEDTLGGNDTLVGNDSLPGNDSIPSSNDSVPGNNSLPGNDSIPGGNTSLPGNDTLPSGNNSLPGNDSIPSGNDSIPSGGDSLSGQDSLPASTGVYEWGNVAIGGGGFVSGLTLHPMVADLAYVWTDVGGSYKHNPATQKWVPLNDWVTRENQNYYGGNGIACHPTNPQVIYMAAGKYSAWAPLGSIFKSINGGQTWAKLPIDLKMDSNDEHRWAGHRLAIDPFNPERVIFGSGHDGIWLTTNGGGNWSKAALTANLTAKVGVLGIKFHPTIQNQVYAIAYGDGVFESTDGGLSWTKLAGSPTQGQQMAFSSGALIVTHKSGVMRYSNGAWTDIKPEAGHYNAISVSPFNQQQIIICKGQSVDSRVYLSNNGGQTWTYKTHTILNTIPWFNNGMAFVWTSTLAFDYHQPGKAWFSNGFGVYTTNDITAEPIQWKTHCNGIEETVAFDVCAPQGALVSSIADVAGFYHDQGVTQYATTRHMGMFDDYHGRHILDIDYCWGYPSNMVSVGGQFWNTSNYRVARSSDGGRTWTRINTWNQVEMPIRVCMSSSNPNLFLVTIKNNRTLRTTDGGNTWAQVLSLPNTVQGGPWNWNSFMVSDRGDGNVFYFYEQGKLYRSNDGGASFNIVYQALPSSQWDFKVLKASPVMGEVYFSLNNSGLHYSSNSGNTFTKLANVNQAHLYCFGPPIAQGEPYAIYLYGKVNNVSGIYRSRDRGLTWQEIGVAGKPLGNEPNCMEANWQRPGEVYIGTNGRGVYYGRPS